MEEIELGKATIVYEGADGETVEETLDNEEIVYARDHWHVRTGTDEDGNDLMTQIPKERVHRVDRTVEKFEDQAGTVRRRVESLASDLRERIPVDVGNGGRRETMRPESGQEEEARTIPVDEGSGGGSGREQGAAEAQSDTESEDGADEERP
jgi:hypothetical protein